jgi:hypothetical protein
VISRRVLTILVTAGVLLPIAFIVVGGVARLLAAMGDASGGTMLDRIALGAVLIWAVDLAWLILSLGINAVAAKPDEPKEE